jgi:hypothetical protein
MPFISTADVKIKRNLIKKAFPKYKFSITCRDYSSINVIIKSGPLDLMEGTDRTSGYEQVNHFWIEKHYEDRPKTQKFLMDLYAIMNKNNGVEVEDGDYGTVPDFYTHISIGEWDCNYTIKK